MSQRERSIIWQSLCRSAATACPGMPAEHVITFTRELVDAHDEDVTAAKTAPETPTKQAKPDTLLEQNEADQVTGKVVFVKRDRADKLRLGVKVEGEEEARFGNAWDDHAGVELERGDQVTATATLKKGNIRWEGIECQE